MGDRRKRVGWSPIAMLWEGGSVVGVGDGPLLARFALARDGAAELAFAALVGRHGPMVSRVCSQVLVDQHAAEDASQAVFLILARRAGSILEPDKLGSWLYGVALRTAREARRRDRRRSTREQAKILVREPSTTDPLESREAAEALHAEIARLPDRYRVPVVLCDLEGLTHQEVALRLRCPASTVGVRLMRARNRLRARLTRRGFAPSMALLAAAPPLTMTNAVARPVLSSLPATAPAVALARDVLRRLTMIRVKLSAATCLSLACVAFSAWAGLHRSAVAQPVADEVQIEVIRPVLRKLVQPVDFVGRIDASRSVEIRSRVSGNLAEVPRDGSKVEAGAGLFVIEAGPFDLRLTEEQFKVEQALARLKVREVDLAIVTALPNEARLVERATAERAEALIGVRISQLAVTRAMLDVDQTRIKAPIAGNLVSVRVQVGDYVKANETVLAVLVQTNPIAATFDVDEQTYLKIRRGAIETGVQGEIKLPVRVGLADTADFPYEGEARIGLARFDPATGTTRFTANIPNPDGAISPGNFARVRIEMEGSRERPSVPTSAIGHNRENDLDYVKVLDANDRVTRRTVRLIPLSERQGIVLVEGVSGEDRVVVDVKAAGGSEGEVVKPRLVPAK